MAQGLTGAVDRVFFCDEGGCHAACELLLGYASLVVFYFDGMLPRREEEKRDVAGVEWLSECVIPPVGVVVVISKEADVIFFVEHLLCPFGVGVSHLLHPGEEAPHEIAVVSVCAGDVVEVHVCPWHDVEFARPAGVDLHASAVAPDELGRHQGPVVVVIHV